MTKVKDLSRLGPRAAAQARTRYAEQGGTDTGSDLENDFLALLHRHGLPEPEREVLYAQPRQFRADFMFRDARLIVECEGGVWTRGKSGHNSGTGIETDCERSRFAALNNFRVFRVTRKSLDEKGEMIAEMLKQIFRETK